MPLKGDRKREYARQYMRERRAAAKAGRVWEPRRPPPPRPTIRDDLNALTARVAQLEAELAATCEAAS
jgi:hypothetical protein